MPPIVNEHNDMFAKTGLLNIGNNINIIVQKLIINKNIPTYKQII